MSVNSSLSNKGQIKYKATAKDVPIPFGTKLGKRMVFLAGSGTLDDKIQQERRNTFISAINGSFQG